MSYEPKKEQSASTLGLDRPKDWWVCQVCRSFIPPNYFHRHWQ